MKYRFDCKPCHKTVLCDSKEEVKKLKEKHWIGEGLKRKHRPVFETCHVETRTSRKSNKPYIVFVAD